MGGDAALMTTTTFYWDGIIGIRCNVLEPFQMSALTWPFFLKVILTKVLI